MTPYSFLWVDIIHESLVLVYKCYLDNCSATFLNFLGPVHLRSGHQVRSLSDPTSEKKSNRASATVAEIKMLNFEDWVYLLPSRYLQLVYLGFFISVI